MKKDLKIHEAELYSEIEYLIIMWSNDGTKTAGFLTRQIMELIETTKMNKEQQELVDGAYNNWHKQFEVDPNNFDVDELVRGHGDQCWGYTILDHVKPTSKEYKRGQINAYLEGKADQPFFYLTKKEFINKCKTDSEFSKRWGLKIEERELSWEERWRLLQVSTNGATIPWDRMGYPPHEWMDNVRTIDSYDKDFNLIKGSDICTPRKIATVTYNDKTIVSYK